MHKYDFKLLDAAFKRVSEDCIIPRPSQEQEMYALFCMGNRLDIQEIDFTKLSSESVDEALRMFGDSVRREDDDGTMSFMRQSAWATYNYMTEIMWNFARTETKKAEPPFPLI